MTKTYLFDKGIALGGKGIILTREEIKKVIRKDKWSLKDLEDPLNFTMGFFKSKNDEGYKVFKEEVEAYEAEKQPKSKSRTKTRRALNPHKKVKK